MNKRREIETLRDLLRRGALCLPKDDQNTFSLFLNSLAPAPLPSFPKKTKIHSWRRKPAAIISKPRRVLKNPNQKELPLGITQGRHCDEQR